MTPCEGRAALLLGVEAGLQVFFVLHFGMVPAL